MGEPGHSSPVLQALLDELSRQGHLHMSASDPSRLKAYPVQGSIDLVGLAEAVENALGGEAPDEEDDAKTPAELNAANDG